MVFGLAIRIVQCSGRPRSGSVRLRFGGGTVRSGSGFRFRRFLCKKGFSASQHSPTRKDGSGSGFGSWKTVPAVPASGSSSVPGSRATLNLSCEPMAIRIAAKRDRRFPRGPNDQKNSIPLECSISIKMFYLDRKFQSRRVHFPTKKIGIIERGYRKLTFAHVREAQRCVRCTFQGSFSVFSI